MTNSLAGSTIKSPKNRAFYGDNSEVLAGVLSADYTVNGTPGVAIGGYDAG
ncbi:hypothetical protein [Planktomarina sp.]|uniref:hypothetical protein n=1 Tax=Planktomarina sp. TaxID=2024851 RepID=UPI003261C8D2